MLEVTKGIKLSRMHERQMRARLEWQRPQRLPATTHYTYCGKFVVCNAGGLRLSPDASDTCLLCEQSFHEEPTLQVFLRHDVKARLWSKPLTCPGSGYLQSPVRVSGSLGKPSGKHF